MFGRRRLTRRVPKEKREDKRRSQNNFCAYCFTFLDGTATVDHIVSKAECEFREWTEEQMNDFSNLQLLCAACHAKKTEMEQYQAQGDDAGVHRKMLELHQYSWRRNVIHVIMQVLKHPHGTYADERKLAQAVVAELAPYLHDEKHPSNPYQESKRNVSNLQDIKISPKLPLVADSLSISPSSPPPSPSPPLSSRKRKSCKTLQVGNYFSSKTPTSLENQFHKVSVPYGQKCPKTLKFEDEYYFVTQDVKYVTPLNNTRNAPWTDEFTRAWLTATEYELQVIIGQSVTLAIRYQVRKAGKKSAILVWKTLDTSEASGWVYVYQKEINHESPADQFEEHRTSISIWNQFFVLMCYHIETCSSSQSASAKLKWGESPPKVITNMPLQLWTSLSTLL